MNDWAVMLAVIGVFGTVLLVMYLLDGEDISEEHEPHQ